MLTGGVSTIASSACLLRLPVQVQHGFSQCAEGLSPIQLHFGNPVYLRSGMGCVVWIVRSSLQLQLLWSIVVLRIALYLHS